MTEQHPPTETPETPKGRGKGKAPTFAAYDETFLRFTGGTHATRDEARKAAKAAGAKAVEVREL